MGDLKHCCQEIDNVSLFQKLEWVMNLFIELGHCPWTFSPEVIILDASRLQHRRRHIFIFSWHLAQSISNAVFTSFLCANVGPNSSRSRRLRMTHCVANWDSLWVRFCDPCELQSLRQVTSKEKCGASLPHLRVPSQWLCSSFVQQRVSKNDAPQVFHFAQ